MTNTRDITKLTGTEEQQLAQLLSCADSPAERSRITWDQIQSLVKYTRNLEAKLAAYEPIHQALSP